MSETDRVELRLPDEVEAWCAGGCKTFTTVPADTPEEERAWTCARCAPQGEPEPFSDAWVERRRLLWNEQAAEIMAAVDRYEDEHPKGAICLAPLHDACGQVQS